MISVLLLNATETGHSIEVSPSSGIEWAESIIPNDDFVLQQFAPQAGTVLEFERRNVDDDRDGVVWPLSTGVSLSCLGDPVLGSVPCWRSAWLL